MYPFPIEGPVLNCRLCGIDNNTCFVLYNCADPFHIGSVEDYHMRERRPNHFSCEPSDQRLERLFVDSVRSLELLAAQWPTTVLEEFEVADHEGNTAVLAERVCGVGGQKHSG